MTLDLSAQFIGGGMIGEPFEARVELLRETGRMLFLRGLIVQEDTPTIASFTGDRSRKRSQAEPPEPDGDDVLDRYDALVAAGELRADPDQAAAAARLDRLQRELEAAPQARSDPVARARQAARCRRAASICGAMSGAASRC